MANTAFKLLGSVLAFTCLGTRYIKAATVYVDRQTVYQEAVSHCSKSMQPGFHTDSRARAAALVHSFEKLSRTTFHG